MSNPRRRGSSLFPGILLLFVGLLLLLHNYRGLDIDEVLGHWWPLILIAWGAIKLYERMTASRRGDSESATITSGEVFLVLGLPLAHRHRLSPSRSAKKKFPATLRIGAETVSSPI